MQRRSGRLKIPANEHVITSMDVIIKYDKKLGEGGFAAVYEGDWKGTRVAVKVLDKGVPASVRYHRASQVINWLISATDDSAGN